MKDIAQYFYHHLGSRQLEPSQYTRRHRSGWSRTASRLVATILIAVGAPATNAVEPTNNLSDEQWIEDIEFMMSQIEFYHPDPYTNMPETEFKREVEDLIAEVPDLSDQHITVRMMQIVENIGDGHSVLAPRNVAGFDEWFPVRFYNLADGLAIMTIAEEHKDLVGARVIRIGRMSAEEASETAWSLMGAESEFGKLERTYHLSNAAAMHALGVIDDPSGLPLDVRTRNGETKTVELEAYQSRYDLSFRFHGEYFMPPVTRAPHSPFASPFPGKTVRDLLVNDPRLNTDIPLHVRSRKAYWFQSIEGENGMYMQINSATAQSAHSDLSFTETYLEMFEAIDASNIETLVLDLRWHGGGDGSVNGGFLREVIKREGLINYPGRFFVLVGKKTYSAACMLVQDLRVHTHAIFIGEPPGEYCNQFGDPAYVTLPNSQMRVSISTLWWQLARSDDHRTRFPIQIPVQMTIEDYFGFKDPLLDAALTARGRRSIYQIVEEDGAAEALAEYEKRRGRFDQFDWWSELHEFRINHLAYELLGSSSEEDKANAVQLFRINTEAHPKSWNAWDSYGDALSRLDRNAEAAEVFRRAIEADPRNWNSQAQRRAIEEFEKAPE